MSKISILFTQPNFITAGSGQVMMNIVKRLDKSRFAPAVCVLRKGGRMDAEVNELGIPFLEAPFSISAKPYLNLPLRLWKASKSFRPYQFQLWHSFHYLDDYTEPLIARLAGAQAWTYTKKTMGWGSRGWLLRSRLATRIVADNSEIPEHLFRKNGLVQKVIVNHHGIPTDQYSPEIAPRLFIRQTLNIPASAIVVVCVANLVERKGQSFLIQALAQIPGIHLILAGRPFEPKYVALLHELTCKFSLEPRVHFVGNIEDVPALLAECDIYVLPTLARWGMEGCPVALLEALSCGKACIATDIPGSRDLVEHGTSGFLIAPENSEAIANALRKMTESSELRKKIGQAARRRVLERFTIEREVKVYESLFQEIAGHLKPL